MFIDKISETIAHFIGQFELMLEQARTREEHTQFSNQEEEAEETEDLNFSQYTANSVYRLTDLEAAVEYKAPDHEIIELRQRLEVDHVKFGPASTDILLNHNIPFLELSAGLNLVPPLYLVPPIPGSIGLAVQQTNTLYDNDLVIDSDLAFDYVEPQTFEDDLQAAALNAGDISALTSIRPPSSEEAIADIIDESRAVSDELDTNSNPLNANVNAIQSDTIQGIYVNGELTDEVPDISQILPPPPEDDETDRQADSVEETPAFEVSTGGNTSINEAVMVEAWIDAPVQMVSGNYISLNIISQTNLLVDSDQLDGVVSSAVQSDHSALVQNIAAFATTSSAATDASAQAEDSMPSSWSVTVLEGNLIFLNWLEQINYIVDNDVVSATASGNNVMIQTGDNLALNAFSILELGYQYDLIVVNGDVYHANIINQINVLFDNDFVATASANVNAGGTAGGGNALWNVASIEQTGVDTTFSLSQAMSGSISNMSSGDLSFQQALASSPELAGYGHLNVLYINGSLLDLQYINQVNVVGDADQVAIDLDDSDMEWSVETGDNTLLNFATIADAGVDSSIYVGGDTYSDALLYQAELIVDEPVYMATDTGQLASEAVLFLSDDMLTETGNPDCDAITPTPAEAPHVDVMQTMLA